NKTISQSRGHLLCSTDLALKAFSGKDKLLPCKAPNDSDLENLVLEWTRPDLEKQYIFLFRDGRPFLVSQHEKFKGRVELSDPTLLSGDLSIKLHNVTQQDKGRYECHIFSKSHVRKRSIKTIEVSPGQDVSLPLKTTDFNVTSVMWKREDDPERFVFLSGMDHPHHQHPQYSGRTELTRDQTGDLTVRLRNVQPGDSGTYHGRIVQLQQRVKRELRPSEPDNIVILKVLSSEWHSDYLQLRAVLQMCTFCLLSNPRAVPCSHDRGVGKKVLNEM
uniref:Ig-like domain-containing protein n=1 Tax=Neogobius melanostomus TaxID=47308 RepID=A0A8C6SKI6_9GOBI